MQESAECMPWKKVFRIPGKSTESDNRFYKNSFVQLAPIIEGNELIYVWFCLFQILSNQKT